MRSRIRGKYTINQDRYLLVEFSDLLIFRNTADIFGRLLEGGMISIVTHPERNQLLQQRLEEIALWVEAGACVQVTGQSLAGALREEGGGVCAYAARSGAGAFHCQRWARFEASSSDHE